MATITNESDSSRENTNNEENDNKDEQNNMFECNICLDNAKDAVVSVCGHLFCWPCLHQWIVTLSSHQVLCPVCKAALNKDKIIPIYGHGNSKQEDPRNKVPPRPAGQRTELEPSSAFSSFFFGDSQGFHLSFGIGSFPFGFSTSLNVTDRPQEVANQLHQDDQYLSKLFLWIAVICIIWLMVA